MKAKLLMVTQKHKEALQILNKIDTTEIIRKQLKVSRLLKQKKTDYTNQNIMIHIF